MNYDWTTYFAATLEQNIRDERRERKARQHGYQDISKPADVIGTMRGTLA